MDQQNLNGRVNILQPDTQKQFALYDRIPAHQPSAYRDALQGNWKDSPLSLAYFSKENIMMIQNGIRKGVYDKSKGQYLIGIQSEDVLKVIMRSTFLQYSGNMPDKITDQIKSLNKIVLDYCIKQVYGEAQGYQQYLYDASTLVVPIEHPVLSSTEDKTLEWKRWF
tara:strand:- start:12287 stop:12784 length:498 start_codon:yes stop_codon:yes gene_type:complete